jgi:hypothetical protein
MPGRRKIAQVVEIQSPYLTVEGLRSYLGFGSRPTQREWRDSGRLAYILIDRQILYRVKDVDRFVEKNLISIRHNNRVN